MSSLRASLAGLRAFLRRFAPQLRANRWLIVAAGVLIIGEVMLRLLEPWPIGFVLDVLLGTSPTPAWARGLSDASLLVVCAGAVVVVAALRALFAYLSTIALALAGNRLLTEVRGELFAHVQRLSLRFHARARTGDLITRLTGDIGRLQEVAVTAALPLVANTATLLGMVIVMLAINWQLALAAMLLLPLTSPTFLTRGRDIRTAGRKQRKREGKMASIAAEGLSAIKVVQALGLEDAMSRSFASQNRASLRDGVQAKRLAAGLERRVDVIAAIGTALVLYLGARQVQDGRLTVGELVVFMFYLKTAFKPLRDLAKYTGRIAQASASGERIIALLDEQPEIVDRPGAVDPGRATGALQFRHVTFGYDPGRPVLRDVSFGAEAGEVVALVGPSGAGKSSTLSLLLRLYDPSDGQVELDGRDLRDLQLGPLRQQMSIVLQGSVLFGLSVRDNIAHGALGATDEQIEAAARLANAHDFITALPEGYDTVLGERGATLSGGQCQRIAIARAAVRDAPIVLLDEPTTGLDEENQRLVSDALRRLSAGRTTLIVAHDLTTIEHADQILYIDGGAILERGTHAALLAKNGAYASVYRQQLLSRGMAPPHAQRSLAPATITERRGLLGRLVGR